MGYVLIAGTPTLLTAIFKIKTNIHIILNTYHLFQMDHLTH